MSCDKNLITSSQGPKGDTGATGATGAQGVQGEQGVSVIDAHISDGSTPIGGTIYAEGHLIIELSDGSFIDTDDVRGPQGPAGADGANGADGSDGSNGSFDWSGYDLSNCWESKIPALIGLDPVVDADAIRDLIFDYICSKLSVLNISPIVISPTITVNCGESVYINLLQYYSGVLPADSYTTQIGNPVENGTLTTISPGIYRFTSNGTCNTSSDFDFVITDTSGTNSNTGTVTILIGADKAIIANNEVATVSEGDTVSIFVYSNDIFPAGVTPVGLVITSPVNPALGITTVISPITGQIDFTANPSVSGSTGFTYRVTGSNGATASATVAINITNSGSNYLQWELLDLKEDLLGTGFEARIAFIPYFDDPTLEIDLSISTLKINKVKVDPATMFDVSGTPTTSSFVGDDSRLNYPVFLFVNTLPANLIVNDVIKSPAPGIELEFNFITTDGRVCSNTQTHSIYQEYPSVTHFV